MVNSVNDWFSAARARSYKDHFMSATWDKPMNEPTRHSPFTPINMVRGDVAVVGEAAIPLSERSGTASLN
jgi:hypothetical protein